MATDTITKSTIDKTDIANIVLAAQGGDRTAFGELFERFQRCVMAIALHRLSDFSDAQELTQDEFVQALVKIKQLRQPECFGGWLRSITHRMAINRIVRRRPDFLTEPETMEATCIENDTPLHFVLLGEQKDQLWAGLRRLGELDRDTLVAFYVKGRSLAEMSNEFKAPLGTIKRRLHVARKRLAREVEELVAI